MSKTMRMILIGLAIIILVSLLLTIEPINRAVSNVVKIPQDKLRNVAKVVASIGIGVLLIVVGVTALASSVVLGAVLLVIGVILLASAVWPLFTRNKIVE